jgi:plastocyanin
MKRRDFLASSVGAGVVLAGCSGGSGQGTDIPTVRILENRYDPRVLSVAAGTTVTWVNSDETVVPHHTVTSDPFLDDSAAWEFDEKVTENGEEVSYTFEDPGLYTYTGEIVGEDCMCGLVAVDTEYDDALPCSQIRGNRC